MMTLQLFSAALDVPFQAFQIDAEVPTLILFLLFI